MSNILFVLYSDFASNSAGHVVALAQELSDLGHSCAVAATDNLGSAERWPDRRFAVVEYSAALTDGITFPDGRGPDIVHAWTPRETVRRFCESLARRYQFQQFVHLEDNEFHLAARLLGRSEKDLQSLTPVQLDSLIPLSLSHPLRATEFLASSRGITIIIEALREAVPQRVPACLLWPSADERLFFPRPIDHNRRAALGVPLNSTVLVYTGNVHAANAAEVRSLYVAVAMLNREGYPTTLIRTGQDFYPFLGEDSTWAKRYSIELGFLGSRAELAEITSLADLFVQPGAPGPFNDFRFPSKLPEFFAVGRPVVLPATNIGLITRHGQDAYVLPQVDAPAIFDAVRDLTTDPALYDRLACGTRAFFEKNLNWRTSAMRLADFYAGV